MPQTVSFPAMMCPWQPWDMQWVGGLEACRPLARPVHTSLFWLK